MTTKKEISPCSIWGSPIYIIDDKIKRTCHHSDKDNIAHRIGLR